MPGDQLLVGLYNLNDLWSGGQVSGASDPFGKFGGRRRTVELETPISELLARRRKRFQSAELTMTSQQVLSINLIISHGAIVQQAVQPNEVDRVSCSNSKLIICLEALEATSGVVVLKEVPYTTGANPSLRASW